MSPVVPASRIGALLAALAWPAACGPGPADPLPHLASREGVDPFVLERVDAALEACRRGEAGARLELAKVYDANGMNELALAGYELCLGAKDEPHVPIVYLEGVVLDALERPTEALAAFEEALRLGDRYAPTHWKAGQLLLDLGRIPEARSAFEAALELEPGSIPAQLGLARVLLLENDPAGVLARLGPMAEANPDERFVHGLLARAQRALGNEAEAERELKREERAGRISVSDPRSAEVRTRATGVLVGLRQANDALEHGDGAAAVALMEKLYARAPQDLAVVQMYAKALIAAEDYGRALEVLEEGAARYPDQFKLELFFGLAYQGQKAHKKALEHLTRARDLNPAYGPTHAALGEVETKFARFPAAEASLTRALECGDSDLRTRILLAQVQLEQKAYARARATAEATCSAFPNAAAAWTYLAEACARLGEAEAARTALAEAERRNPKYERIGLVQALLEPAEGQR